MMTNWTVSSANVEHQRRKTRKIQAYRSGLITKAEFDLCSKQHANVSYNYEWIYYFGYPVGVGQARSYSLYDGRAEYLEKAKLMGALEGEEV